MHRIEIEADQRILILDGAMGTMIQQAGPVEDDFRGFLLKDHKIELKGNNDLLCLTAPDLILQIHKEYVLAGADILSTNTFGANRISQADYDTAHLSYEMNRQGAILAREAARSADKRPIFVAGAMGPTTKLGSLSPDVNDPGYRSVSFDELVEAYQEQIEGLLDGGVDLFLLETVTDTLNAKAAIYALMNTFERRGKSYPVMVSGTITDASGRILSGQTIEAFLISVSHAPLFSVGLNCSLGAKELYPFVHDLHRASPFRVSVHPNAGLPNAFGSYDQSAGEFADLVRSMAEQGWLNIVGGCCGTTPAHIRAAAKALRDVVPRRSRHAPHATEQRVTTAAPVVEAVEAWHPSHENPTFDLPGLLSMIASIEDEATLRAFKSRFDKERALYHSEQAMLAGAHLIGRFQYLREESRLRRSA